MSDAPSISIEVPPFPRLTWDGFAWEGKTALPSWRGWWNRIGARGRARRAVGAVDLIVVHPLLVEDSPRHLPSRAQRIGYEYAIANERAMAEAAQRALWAYTRPEIGIQLQRVGRGARRRPADARQAGGARGARGRRLSRRRSGGGCR
jgi:hypothetical protein